LDIQGRSWQEAGEDCIMRKMRNAYKIFVEKLEGKRRLGRSLHRWEVILK